MPNLIKSPKKTTERLTDLKPYNTIRVKLILENAIGELNLMIAHEMENLDDTEMKIMMQDGKIRFQRIKNSLDEFEMNEKEPNVKKIKNIIDCLKKTKPELLDLYRNKNRDKTNYLKKSESE